MQVDYFVSSGGGKFLEGPEGPRRAPPGQGNFATPDRMGVPHRLLANSPGVCRWPILLPMAASLAAESSINSSSGRYFG